MTKPTDVDRLMDVGRMSSDGKDATAPCGHPGEHVMGNWIRCLQGCDRYATTQGNARVERAKTEPGHGAAQAPAGQALCRHPGVRPGQQTCHYCHAPVKPKTSGCRHRNTIGFRDPHDPRRKLLTKCIDCSKVLP